MKLHHITCITCHYMQTKMLMSNMTDISNMYPVHIRHIDAGLDILFVILIYIFCISVNCVAHYIAYICPICKIICQIICKGLFWTYWNFNGPSPPKGTQQQPTPRGRRHIAICRICRICKIICSSM